MGFPFVNLALTVEEFVAYLATYNFGTIPPDSLVFHHTVDPCATWAPYAKGKMWDAGEEGLTPEQVKAKRLRQLGNLKNYYQHTLGWTAGPHLFIDDLYIYLMTPMSDIGVHAKWGNSFTRDGKLHYSIGVEVVGYYELVTWPAPVQAVVRGAVQALHRRLGTFDLRYMYADGERPGMLGTGDGQRCARPELLRWGGLASHRDFNKPQCPGRAITEAFYTQVVRGELDAAPVESSAGQVTEKLTPPAAARVASVTTSYQVKPRIKATVRSAPRRDPKNIIEQLKAGTPVDGEPVTGEAVDGNPTWVQIAPGRYVHSSALTPR